MLSSGVTSDAGDFAAFAASDGFEDVIKPAVMNAGIWWVNEREISFSQIVGHLVRVGNLSTAAALSTLHGQCLKRYACLGDNILVPGLEQIALRRSSRMKRLCCMPWRCGTLAR